MPEIEERLRSIRTEGHIEGPNPLTAEASNLLDLFKVQKKLPSEDTDLLLPSPFPFEKCGPDTSSQSPETNHGLNTGDKKYTAADFMEPYDNKPGLKPNEKPQNSANGPRDVEVAKGMNDISDALGKGAKLIRGDRSDVLILQNGCRIEVKRDHVNRDGLAMISIKFRKNTTELRISTGESPIANINDGMSKTMIKVSANGQIESIRTNGKLYKFVAPKLE